MRHGERGQTPKNVTRLENAVGTPRQLRTFFHFRGMFVAILWFESQLVCLNPICSHEINHFPSLTLQVATGPGKWLSCVVVAQKIYGIPDRASNVLVFDPTTEDVWMEKHVGHPWTKWRCSHVLDGKITSSMMFVYCRGTETLRLYPERLVFYTTCL